MDFLTFVFQVAATAVALPAPIIAGLKRLHAIGDAFGKFPDPATFDSLSALIPEASSEHQMLAEVQRRGSVALAIDYLAPPLGPAAAIPFILGGLTWVMFTLWLDPSAPTQTLPALTAITAISIGALTVAWAALAIGSHRVYKARRTWLQDFAQHGKRSADFRAEYDQFVLTQPQIVARLSRWVQRKQSAASPHRRPIDNPSPQPIR